MSSPSSSNHNRLRAAWAGAAYFGLVFAAGFVFGAIRQIWAVPRFGVRISELLEMPLMLVVIVLAARWTVARFGVPPSIGKRLAVGIIALGLLLIAEAMLVLGLSGITLTEYIAGRDPVSGTAYIVMLAVYALMPALLGRYPSQSTQRP